jgi:hypothetical protein
MFVVKMESDGDLVWDRRMPSNDLRGGSTYDVATDSAGNVYTVGVFYGTVDFDPNPPTFNLASAGNGG